MQEQTVNTDFLNKFSAGKKHFEAIFKAGKLTACSPGFITGHCKTDHGHKFMRSLQCGREYCPDCGRDGSPIHSRRINRWMPKVKTMQSVGYLVITVPPACRLAFHSKAVLSDFRMLLRKKLVRMGYKRGLMRWHYYGDCSSCNGKGCAACNNTGAGKKWHPHLNVLIEASWMDLKDMTEIKAWAQQYFNRHSKGAPAPVNMHYSFAANENEAVNRVKYITRSTFRIYNAATAKMLYKYNSTSCWGKWKMKISAEEALDNNCCPLCKFNEKESPVKWFKLNTANNYTGTAVIHLKNGNYIAIRKDEMRNPSFAVTGQTIKGRPRENIATTLRPPGYSAAHR